jgi:hypothetical protein
MESLAAQISDWRLVIPALVVGVVPYSVHLQFLEVEAACLAP